jgi:hypothetical protein
MGVGDQCGVLVLLILGVLRCSRRRHLESDGCMKT